MKNIIRSVIKQAEASLTIMLILTFFGCDDNYQLEPVLNTFEAADSNITSTTATLYGQIQVLGTQNITEYGIELYKTIITNLVQTKSFTTTANLETFKAEFTDLQPNTLYYFWAYAKVNTANVHSQNVPHFTTKAK